MEANEGILQHQRKRKMELKCLELEELLQEQGYKEEEIAEKVRASGGLKQQRQWNPVLTGLLKLLFLMKLISWIKELFNSAENLMINSPRKK